MILKVVLFSTFIVTVAAQINLAPHGVAVQRTTYKGYYANLAIEGPANNKWADGCSATAANQKYAWWGLQLPALAHITNIVIYYMENFPDRMDEFRLYLGNSTADRVYFDDLCYTDIGVAGLPDIIQNISCFMLAKNVYFVNRRPNGTCIVELCYVAIYGCFKGTWGPNCTESCPPTCIGQHCYPVNGSCVWGCDPNNCVNNQCDKDTGSCTEGCVVGRAGQYCTSYNIASKATATQKPPNPSFPAILSIDGNRTNGNCSMTTGPGSYLQVDTGSISVVTTVYLTFGDTLTLTTGGNVVYCSNTSNYWFDGIVLYKGERPTKDINVFAVCRYVIFVPFDANGVSTVDVCEIEIGGCPFGRYGMNCEKYCHCNGPCDLITGICTTDCLDGWVGDRCDIACEGGYFGRDCTLACSANCLNPPCNQVSGECNGGCNKGWEGYNCTKECDIGHFGLNCSQTCFGCISIMCDKVNGVCNNPSGCKAGYLNGQYCNQECDDMYFGINCENKCNCRTKHCNKFNGACSAEGCDKGWHGASCNKECSYGYFGFSCKDFCETCYNNSCDILEGNCRAGCIDGYRGHMCTLSVLADSNCTDSPLSALIGLFFGALLLGSLLTVGIMCFITRRRICITQGQTNKTDNPKSHERQYDNLGMETVSTYQDLTASSVSNEYDQIDTIYSKE